MSTTTPTNSTPSQELIGSIRLTGKGIGYVRTAENPEMSIEIDPAFLNTAMHRDTVKVALHAKKGDQMTGEVIEIVKRNKLELVGTLVEDGGIMYVDADDPKMYVSIAIPKEALAGAAVGQKLLVRIVHWSDPKKNPIGEVLRIIGKPGEHDVEMQTIVLEKGFRPEFPPDVEREAKALQEQAAVDIAAEGAKRRDFRQIFTCTIDPVDAKDFDDALSYQKLPDGTIEIGVHIADVSHYVRPGTALDREASKRTTSIYLVDRTIPMLPEGLSNDICSLVPNEDRLTFGAVFTFDPNYNLTGEWFGKTIIHSARRFSYEEAQEVLEKKSEERAEELRTMNDIAYKLREQKLAAGALTFEEDEVKFKLDEKGVPVSVYKKERKDAHKMIEDFMLLANKKVAEYVSRLVKDKPKMFVYRIHDAPDLERIMQLASFLRPLGYKLEIKNDRVVPQSINNLLAQSAGTPEADMIARATVKSMSKAIYSMVNIGHYGLAFEYYSHFTSPIRRYPDLMVHRLLEIYLAGKIPSDEMLEEYGSLAIRSSDMERLASEAERDSIKYKQVEYMLSRIGQEYDGVISGITEWGIYVEELETKSEGMVRLRDLKDDFYEFDEKQYAMIGQKTKRKFRLGDKVRVKVANADIKRRIIDYVFI
ncbi:MAG TPA: ribonuclease R [Candidatus Paceibacterota bacterium]|nr:ribonuclease R [Candidatus Paceibacterota bacterium]